ncbi:MAG: methylated-DNA--[protein]-cysteine S-methyltransferase [Eubacteriales bacterium]|nr:methylated-DNA--[protein]-cysteine S-methyltransferase [Eubacteriales bacterium]
MKYYIYESAVGPLTIAEENGILTNVCFGEWEYGEKEETPFLAEVWKQLQEYFAGQRKCFDLPLAPAGTEFQKKVWEALMTIPYGEVRTYGQIAAQIGNPKASRAVGMANYNNPIGIIIPCHRVIGADGKLTGYAGGMEKKEQLLHLEGTY